MNASKLISLAVLATLAATVGACYGSSNPDEDTQVQGQCDYQDAETDHAGQPQEPATPEPQDTDPENPRPMQVEVRVKGNGALSGLKPECQLDGASGQFKGLLSGEGEISEDGFYFAGMNSNEAELTTPSLQCEIPDLHIDAFTEVVIRALIENTSRNCKNYCEAKARHHAEAECGSSSTAQYCRAREEGEYSASCRQECSGSTTRRIVAETKLGLAALAELNAKGLGFSGLSEMQVDLTFDRIEESNGEVVQEQ